MSTGDDQSLTVNLGLLDLLYAVPVSDLAVRVSGADLGRVSMADWANLVVCMAVIILSWIGLHRNRVEMAASLKTHRRWISVTDYLSLRFLQYTVELVIIVLYFVLGLKIHLPTSNDRSASTPDMTWLVGTLLVIFVGYLIWDILDVTLAMRDHMVYWRDRAIAGGIVTAAASVLVLAMYLVVRSTTTTTTSALTWSILSIALLYFYRVVQQNQVNRFDRTEAAAT